MTLFDFDDRYVDDAGVGSAISRREGVLASLVAHALFVLAALWLPEMPWFRALAAPVPAAVVPVTEQDRRSTPFMLVEAAPAPPAPPKQPAIASDVDRRARSNERAPNPSNHQPYSRGNSADLVDGTPAPPVSGPAPSPPSPAPPSATPAQPVTASPVPGAVQQQRAASTPPPSGLGASLRNMDQMIRRERFDNPQGGEFDPNAPAISFDSKGVDFGPWLSRFVARVKRNWLVPYAAQTMSGRVVITFWVHRDGRITDIQVLRPSAVSSFNTAAFQALVQSNPTLALPAEYPDDKMQITATFFYNERPR